MSNPIHSTSAKSVLPMLAMRGLATGLCAGCVVGLLRLSHDRAAARVALWLEEWREVWWTVPIWFGVLVALAVILRRIVREEPLISGSGIPQTELALAGRLSFTWWRVLLAKFLGSWLALFGGLALGREGPSIQMGGAVGAGFHALWRPAPPHALTGSPYVVAGAVAGLAAAFGAPAAGVLAAFYAVLMALAMIGLEGWLLVLPVLAVYLVILRNLVKLSRSLEDTGYAVHAAPVRLSMAAVLWGIWA